jgi:predicted permease
MLNDLRFRLRALVRRNVVESELDQELSFHFEQQVRKYQQAGMTRAGSTREARLAFGGLEQIKEDCREARGTSLLETSFQDIRFALRAYRKSPGFFLIAVLTLALGIGASTAVFSLVNTILLKPLPYPKASRVVMPWRHGPIGSLFGSDSLPWNELEFTQLKEIATAFQNLGAFKEDDFNLTGSGSPEHLDGVRASAGFFFTLGVAPLRGRTFTTAEDRPGSALVVVLSHRLWQSRFGGDPGVLGRVVNLNGFQYTVIGVMPAGFNFPNGDGMPKSIKVPKYPQLWVPLALPVAPVNGPSELSVIAEAKPNMGLAEVIQDLATFDRRWQTKFPRWNGTFTQVASLARQSVSGTHRPLLLLLAAVCVVLLIACSNVAGLMLNRSLGRQREFTLRGALGVRRGRLIGQLMTESLLLALTGGIVGTLFGQASLFLVKRFGPDSIPRLREIGLDTRVLIFALGVTLVTGVLFGLVPAFGATRMNLVEALKEGGQRPGGSATAPRIRNALLISHVALALVLVVAAGLLVRTFYHMIRANSGFDAAHVVTFELPLPSSKYSETGHMAQIYNQVLQRLEATPGVESAGLVSIVAMGGPTDSTDIRIPGIPPPQPGSPAPFANYLFVSPHYFATIGTPLQRGRDITDGDILGSAPVTIINSAMAKKYWPGQDPVGKQVGVGLTKIPVRTIVGVAADIKQVSLREDPAPTMFVPYTQNEMKTFPNMQALQYAVRAQGDEAAITASVREAVHAVDPDLPIAGYATLATLVETSTTADRFAMVLVAAFGVLALVLAAIGMYGVISYSVSQRTPEIGVRIALGAQRSQIFIMVLKQGSRLACAGIAIGTVGALAATRLMTRFLYGVQPTDPGTFVGASLLLTAIALLACYLPARRAMKIDPMILLRYE